MDAGTFDKILQKLNEKFLSEKKFCCLLITVPRKLNNFIGINFFPPNGVAKCQSMDMGVISALKQNYKTGVQRRQIQALNCDVESITLTVLDAVSLIEKSWENVSSSTIVNCSRKLDSLWMSQNLLMKK